MAERREAGKTPRDLKGKWRQLNAGVEERIFPAKCTAFVRKLQVKRQRGGFEEPEEIQGGRAPGEMGLERKVWADTKHTLMVSRPWLYHLLQRQVS